MMISIIQLLSVCDFICLDFMFDTYGKAWTSIFQKMILEYFTILNTVAFKIEVFLLFLSNLHLIW